MRMKRQLWRCIIIRDMLLSMGLRVPAKMSRADLDLDGLLSTIDEDYNSTPYPSQLFDAPTKHTLAQLFDFQLRLALIAINISALAYTSFPDLHAWWFSLLDFRQAADQIRGAEADLDRWAACSVALVFATLSDTLPVSLVAKSYGQLILIHYK